MFRINTNVLSINGQRNLFAVSKDLNKRMERLSSGLRIVRAADDAAGLTISETMRAQLAGARKANENVSRAITLLQVADSGLEQIGAMFTRLKELAIQAADGTLNDNNRSAVVSEAKALIAEIDRIAETTVFNSITLLADGVGTFFSFYVGDGTHQNADTVEVLGFTLGGVNLSAAGAGHIGGTTVTLSPDSLGAQTTAIALVTSFDNAVRLVAEIRTQLGAFQNRLQRAQSQLLVEIENTSNAESTIRDADFAVEASALTRAQILVQAGTAMLSQANLLPQNALTLLQA